MQCSINAANPFCKIRGLRNKIRVAFTTIESSMWEVINNPVEFPPLELRKNLHSGSIHSM